ncbi:MAG: hypothetical protein VXZ14_06145 [Bacteroidota bacterium]|nr:hypothetical protein [Bacteroidota bacterium]MEC8408133.1 hypothetical protein [Bacteroidota bacterium]
MSQKPLLKSRLFKLPQHRRFNFPARYYDENKERLENRIKELESDSHHYNIKNAFSKNHQYKSWNKNWNTIRLLIIFGILVFSMVFLYNQIDLVVNALNNK